MEKGPQANAGQPALVLLDVGLPGIDGYGVCGCIRATLELRAAVLSAHTSYGQDSDRKKSFGEGSTINLSIHAIWPGSVAL